MRLIHFITENLEPILMEWEVFARALLPGTHLDPVALRDHAREILLATVRDMGTDQTVQEEKDKSAGRGQDSAHSLQLDDASGHHAISRVEAGFDIMELVSEYRALRASVIRLWQNSLPDPDSRDLEDITRFNEAMDQSLAKAVQGYTRRVDQTRDTFLAILGHDLRTPLASINMAATALRRMVSDPQTAAMANVMVRSSRAMDEMVGDLLRYASTTLGMRIPLKPVETDLVFLCEDVVDETRAAFPQCVVQFEQDGPITGVWDPGRLREVLSNLMANAVHHRQGTDMPVTVKVVADVNEAHVSVHNGGDPIPPALLPLIFQPMVRADHASSHHRNGLGLGLAIVERVVTAHGGRVEVNSTADAGTTFTVHVPLHAHSPAGAVR